YDWDGIPGVMSRSNLRAKDSVGGYNIITIAEGKASYSVRHPLLETQKPWVEIPLVDHHFSTEKKAYKRPDYSVNTKYLDKVAVAWSFQDDADLGAGFAVYKDLIITGNTKGDIYA